MPDLICGQDVEPRSYPLRYSNLCPAPQLGGSVNFAEIFKCEGEGTVFPPGTVDVSSLAALSHGREKRQKK
jgi:hypothetical protein